MFTTIGSRAQRNRQPTGLTQIKLNPLASIVWGQATTTLSEAAPATFQFGAADSATPVAQVLQPQSVAAGTTNTAGADFTIKGSGSTGSALGGSIVFATSANQASGSNFNSRFERARINGFGCFMVNQTADVNAEATATRFSVAANGANNWGYVLVGFGNNGSPAGILQAKTRGATATTAAAVINGDTIGGDYYDGNDGTNYIRAATMLCVVDGTVAAGIVPGRFEFHTNSSTGANVEAMRIDSAGRVGISTGAAPIGASFGTPYLQVLGTGIDSGSFGVYRFVASAGGARMAIGHSRGATIGDKSVSLNANDNIGELVFDGSAGGNFLSAASILVVADGAAGSLNMPGRIQFQTTPAGSSAPTERMRIDNLGLVRVNLAGADPFIESVNTRFLVAADNSTWGMGVLAYGANATAPGIVQVKTRNASPSVHSAVVNNDVIGAFYFNGSDGTNYIEAAKIVSKVDGTPAANSMPGRLEFYTTASGQSVPTERLRLDNTGMEIHWGGANGQSLNRTVLTELTTIAAAATTTTAIQIPAGAVVFGVSVRVITIIPTAATFTVTAGGKTFNTAAVAVAAGSNDPGTAVGPVFFASATSITITPNLTPGAATGQVRVTIHYYTITPPTS